MKKIYALKTFCALFLFALVGLTAQAEDVKFDFGANEWGLPIGEGTGASADAGNITAPIVKDGVTLTFDQAGASTSPRMWKGPQVRTYKGNTLTVTAPEGRNITAVNFTTDGDSNFGFAVDGTDVDLKAGWSGSAASVVFTGTKTSRLLTLTVTLDGEGGDTPAPQRRTLFSESFADGQGDFTVNDVNVGDFYVWAPDTEWGYMKASAFVGGTNNASESWLLSPVIDLTAATECQLAFSHAGNFFGSTEGMQAAVAVKARVEGSEEWTDLTVEGWPAGNSWTFVDATADLSAFDGQRVQLAFVYTSTADQAGTWEVKNLAVTGLAEAAPEPEPEPGVYFEETFAEGQGDFTVNDVNVGDFYVWAPDSRYACMKASAFVGGTNYASESWLVSPVIDLTAAQNVTLSFEQAGNFFTGEGGMPAAVSVKAAAEGSDEWTTLTLDAWPAGNSWTFSPSVADLSAFAGQRVRIAFVYTSVDGAAGTWEVKNVKVAEAEGPAPVDVAEPTFSPEAGTYTEPVEVTLTAEDGLTIYYTTDGSEPTTASTRYEAPFTLTETATVQAIAADAEGNLSDVVSAKYVINQPLAVPEGCVGFDFTNNPWGLPVSSQEAGDFEITRVEQDGVILTATSGTTPTRMWSDYNLGLQLRVYNGGTLTFTAPEGHNIVKIEFNASKFDLSATDGTLIDQTWEGNASAVTFTAGGTTNISTVILTFDNPVTGIDGVTTAPAGQDVIYTIDGRRVERAERGLYIINGRKVYVK